ncbi:hypothetical protein H9L13_12505 [Sphingomonas lutea]|uniref:YdcH family protein n=1 Tax=Sphingomonas lutea TaxID=1045317 RepID=A0A7G9SHR6_9SPHN|nr:hypothetical protein [Sphingomonas lutea]QNN67391.1 hypothetical protein H9L13_12505 [Sphingomonas lutea]
MNPRLYRLTETLQRIDRALRREERQARPDAATLIGLRRLKSRAKALIGRALRRPATA